jgi:hypothetical protein
MLPPCVLAPCNMQAGNWNRRFSVSELVTSVADN